MRRLKNSSYLYSFAIHLVIGLLLFFIKIADNYEEDDFVTIGFGSLASTSSQGAVGQKAPVENRLPEIKPKQETKVKEEKVELPKTENSSDDNTITKIDKDESKKEEVKPAPKPVIKEELSEAKGKEESGDGAGSTGFQIDFGGSGVRKIYSYILPEYPEGVSKEIDVKLRFTIMPDGTVSKIFPLFKADTKLELAAINSLKQWRFEPIPSGKKRSEQNAIIIFPYRLQ
jgi:protein TonB